MGHEILKIKKLPGVCGVEEETRLLAEIASKYKDKKRVLDLGCGTGYIAIYLDKLGYDVDATDVSEMALENTRLNAGLNQANIRIFKSDLYENIKGKYDIIIFSVPLSGNGTKLQKVVKSFLREHKFFYRSLTKVGDVFYAPRRRKLLVRFIEKSRHYLKEGGVILMCSVLSDKRYIESKGYNIQSLDLVMSGLGGVFRL